MFFDVPPQLQYFSTWSTYGHLGQAAIQCIHQPEDPLMPWTTCCWGHTRLNKTSASMLTPPKRIKWKYQVQLLYWFCLTFPMVWQKTCVQGKINLHYFSFADVEEDTTPQKGGCWWSWVLEVQEEDEDDEYEEDDKYGDENGDEDDELVEDATPQCWCEWGWPAGWGCEADEADEDVRMMSIRRMNQTPNEPL